LPGEADDVKPVALTWELDSEPEYDALIEVVPEKWLRWNAS